MSQVPVTVSTRGPVAVIAVDDGAANVLNLDIMNSLLSAFKAAQEDAGAIVLAGRPGCFSTGLDLETLLSGGEDMSQLLHNGTELILRLVEFPRPVVAACTGQALGAAAAALLSCDVRIGVPGDYKIGFNWVASGIRVPDLAVELARARLSPRHMTLACNTAQLYSPDEAVEAGFLDSVTTGDAVEQACEVAADLAERLDRNAFEATRTATCRHFTDAIMRTAGDLWRVQQSIRQDADGQDD